MSLMIAKDRRDVGCCLDIPRVVELGRETSYIEHIFSV